MLRIVSVLVLIGLLTDAHPPHAATWNTLPALPEGRFGAASAATGDRLYVLGGFTSLGPTFDAFVWDATAQSWSQAAPMMQARLFAAGAAASTGVLAIGGFVDGMPSASGERLDPVTGTWSAIEPMPAARASFGAGVIGDAVFVAGGQGDDSSNLPQCLRYDPVANTWTAVASLPTPRSGVAAAVLDGQLWVIGGMDAQPMSQVERFDPVTNQWTTSTSLPEPLWFAAAAAFEGRVWVAGGMDASFTRSDRVYSAGPDGAWRVETALPAALALSAMGKAGHCLTVAGGMDASGNPSVLGFAQCVDAPPPPPPPPPPAETLHVAVSLSPATLEQSSNGQWIDAKIEPTGFSALLIDPRSLLLNGEPMDPSGPMTADETQLSVKFRRAPFTTLPSGTYVLELTGNLEDDTPLAGEVALKVHGSVLQQKKPPRALQASAANEPRGFTFRLDRAERVRLDVIDLQGRRVERLWEGSLEAGEHRREWPAAGRSVARGSYFVRLSRESGVDVIRLAVLR